MVDPEINRGETVSFDRVAPVYDATRRMSEEVCMEIAREVTTEAGNREGILVGDIGSGTGRFSIPLAIRGCRVVGVDVSREMARIMLSKLRQSWRSRIQPLVADAQNLPFKPNVFDAVLCFQLLHLIQGWHSVIAEAQQVLAPGGVLAVGKSIKRGLTADISYKYREISAKHGYPRKRLGAETLNEVSQYLLSENYSVPSEPEKHTWMGRMTINAIIQGLADRVYSGTWDVPDEVHHEIIQELREWANKRFSNLDISREAAYEFEVAFARFRASRK